MRVVTLLLITRSLRHFDSVTERQTRGNFFQNYYQYMNPTH